MSARRVHLSYSLSPFGFSPEAWQHQPRRHLSFEGLSDQVVNAERAGFHSITLLDRLGVRPLKYISSIAIPFEPTTLVSALSSRAKDLGFFAAAATDQHEAYNLARRFASLDTLSGGRSGWLIVNAGHSDRDREYIDVVQRLWDSWEDDAFLLDKETGRFFEPSKMHVIDHVGAHLSVRGPLNVNRSPQGRPVIAAVFSDRAILTNVEVIFIQAETEDETQRMLDDLFLRLGQHGRSRADVRVILNVAPTSDDDQQDGVVMGDAATGARAVRFKGNASSIATEMMALFESGSVDGFNFLPPQATSKTAFVIAEKISGRRSESRTGHSLRELLGLPRPAHPVAHEEA